MTEQLKKEGMVFAETMAAIYAKYNMSIEDVEKLQNILMAFTRWSNSAATEEIMHETR